MEHSTQKEHLGQLPTTASAKMDSDQDSLDRLESTVNKIVTDMRQMRQAVISAIEISREHVKQLMVDWVDAPYDRRVQLANANSIFTAFEDLAEMFYDAKSDHETRETPPALAALQESVRRLLLADKSESLRWFPDEASFRRITARLEKAVQPILLAGQLELAALNE